MFLFIQHIHCPTIAFLDFSKAFDSVSYSHLIRRLDQSGIKGPLLQWFTSYLTDRMHRDPYLGLLCLPYLSTIYCRVLCYSSNLALFADDAKCFHTIRSVSDCEWSDEGNLVFNSDKCSLCSVTRKSEPITYDYTMGTKPLISVDA